jgi:hypothetical protein
MKKERAEKSKDAGSTEHDEVKSTTDEVAEMRAARARKFREAMDEINQKYAGLFRRLSG